MASSPISLAEVRICVRTPVYIGLGTFLPTCVSLTLAESMLTIPIFPCGFSRVLLDLSLEFCPVYEFFAPILLYAM